MSKTVINAALMMYFDFFLSKSVNSQDFQGLVLIDKTAL